MSEFIQQAINGLRMGSVYALIALGYTMVYGIIRLINFAHGDFIMVGAYTLIFTIPVMLGFGLPAWVAVAAAVIVASAVGVTTEAVAYRPVRKRGTRMSALITAIAMSLFLENLAQVLFTSNPRVIKASIFSLPAVQIGAVKIDGTTLATIAISAVTMVCLQLFIHKQKWAAPCGPFPKTSKPLFLWGSTSTEPSRSPLPSALLWLRWQRSCIALSIPP